MDKPVALISTPKTFTATTTSAANDLPSQLRDSGSIYEQFVVTNLGTVVVYMALGSASTLSVTASGADRGYPLLPGTSQSLTIGAARKVALITVSGTADVSFQLAGGSN